MEITVTKKHVVKYSVEYFEGTEGGLDSDTFQSGMATISEAIVALEIARLSKPGYDWIITVEVTTVVTGSQS